MNLGEKFVEFRLRKPKVRRNRLWINIVIRHYYILMLLFVQRSYQEIFVKLWKTITCDLPWLKCNGLKKDSPLKNLVKGSDLEIINFQE